VTKAQEMLKEVTLLSNDLDRTIDPAQSKRAIEKILKEFPGKILEIQKRIAILTEIQETYTTHQQSILDPEKLMDLLLENADKAFP